MAAGSILVLDRISLRKEEQEPPRAWSGRPYLQCIARRGILKSAFQKGVREGENIREISKSDSQSCRVWGLWLIDLR